MLHERATMPPAIPETAESSVREREERLRLALDAGSMGVWEVDDRTGLVRIDEREEALLGFPDGTRQVSREEFLARVHPADRERLRACVAAAREHGREFSFEFRVVGAGGALRWISTRGRWVAAPGGTPERILGVNYEVTERKRAEDELRRGERFLRRVLDATPSMVFVKDVHGRFVLCNESLARCYGSTVQDIVGRSDRDFNPNEEEVEHFRRDDEEVIRSRREKLIAEEPVTCADGRVRWFSTVKVPLVQEDGSCSHVLGVATDITDRKRAEHALVESEAELRTADRRKDEFLAMLSHELRNPLAAITGAAETIRARLARGEGADRPLQILQRQVRNAGRLLDDLLDVSRITRGVLELKRTRVALDPVVQGAVDAQRGLLDARRQRLTVDVPDPSLHVFGDSTRLEQILSNLLHNAAKYTPEGGEITVAVAPRGAEVEVRVADTGAGIAPDLLPHIFDAFVQGEQPLARTAGGLGLGLAIVRQLVEMHGGTIEARSAGPGRGSEFIVRLPRDASEAAGAPESPGGEAVPPRGRRILLVEDNVDTAEVIAEYLRAIGHEVVAVHDGASALAVEAQLDPEIVLLDIGLPRLDGYEVARELRRRRPGNRPVLVAMTGYGQEADRLRSRAAGFAHHLTKPFELDVLERLVEAVTPATP